MSRTALISGLFVALLVLVSLFAPAPVSRTVLAEQGRGNGSGPSPACQGLQVAYEACRSNDGDHDGCAHIREQLVAHGCFLGSSSGSSR